jgi:uncharacterized protein (DUF4415 family)
MNAKHGRSATASTERKGKTNWKRVRMQKDADIAYTDDAPRTKPEDWAKAVAHRGLPVPMRKEQIALRVDADVLEWYRAQGPGYQTRINAVLRAFRDASL